MIDRFETNQIYVGNVPIGGNAPISIQSMTYTKTHDVNATVMQIRKLQLAGCDIVRVAVPHSEDARALLKIKQQINIPLIADIHFNHRLAIEVAKYVDCIRINPGNIGSKSKVKEVVKACRDYAIPIRIGVNAGSLEKEFDTKYGATAKGMVESALYNIKYLEDLGFYNIKVSLKASDALRTIEAYRTLRPLTKHPFHIGVTEAGTLFHSTIKSSIALGTLLLDGIGDTMRVSITGELEKEIDVARAILQDTGIDKSKINIISCPTCGRIEADLLKAMDIIEPRIKHVDVPINVAIMGCVVNAIGEAAHADIAIAFGKKYGIIIKKGETIAKLEEDKLIDRFVQEVFTVAKEYKEKHNIE